MTTEQKRTETSFWLYCLVIMAVCFFLGASTAHCETRVRRAMPYHAACLQYDLNHDGQVNVQDMQIAVKRGDYALYNAILQAILSGACDATR